MKRKIPKVIRIDFKVIVVSMILPPSFLEDWKIRSCSVQELLACLFVLMVMGLYLQLHTHTSYGQEEASVNCPIGSIVSVGCSHTDSVALSTLKDKEEKIMKLETPASFHRNVD